MQEIRRYSLSARVLAVILFAALLYAPAAIAAPKEGDQLPKITLAKPGDSSQREYLGLSGWGSFSVTDIKARIVLIEFFSMYCPHCQAEAPATRELYALVQADRKLKDTVRLIGIGIGNSDFEVNLFRKKYSVPFPLFSDDDYAIQEKLKIQYTPHYVAVRIEGNGRARVVYSRSGGMNNPKELIDILSRL